MNLEVIGAIYHFYSMQVVLTCAANRAIAYLLELFHLGMQFCREICEDMDTHPIYLAENFHRYAPSLGYCNASSVGVGGVWIDPHKYGVNRVWRVQ